MKLFVCVCEDERSEGGDALVSLIYATLNLYWRHSSGS